MPSLVSYIIYSIEPTLQLSSLQFKKYKPGCHLTFHSSDDLARNTRPIRSPLQTSVQSCDSLQILEHLCQLWMSFESKDPNPCFLLGVPELMYSEAVPIPNSAPLAWLPQHGRHQQHVEQLRVQNRKELVWRASNQLVMSSASCLVRWSSVRWRRCLQSTLSGPEIIF